MKTCSKCLVEKSFDNFHKQPQGKNGLHPRCKGCRRQQYKDYYDNYEKERQRVKHNPVRWRKYKYGLNDTDYASMLEAQDGKCKICGVVAKRFDVDHCHSTNKVRGLLCHKCNWVLGQVNDDVGILQNMINYLES